MPPPSQFDPERAKRLLDEAAAFNARHAAKAEEKPGQTFEDVKAELLRAFETLPEKVTLPYEMTEEGRRMAEFKRVMADSPEFMAKIDRTLLPNPVAFDAVAKWSGTYPGPCAFGATDTAKTRAAFSALGRLYVHENRSFAWFPARHLVNELARYEERNAASDFFRTYDFHRILFVDDADKINWQFESQKSALFSFYDWIYRHRKPCITTTNKDQAWWAERMGEAFARRLFVDACRGVKF